MTGAIPSSTMNSDRHQNVQINLRFQCNEKPPLILQISIIFHLVGETYTAFQTILRTHFNEIPIYLEILM